MLPTANIVQAEFFHIDLKGNIPIEELHARCADRAIDGLPIKTSVRFYDIDGDITLFVRELALAEEAGIKMAKTTKTTQGNHQWWSGVRYQKHTNRYHTKREKLTPMILAKAKDAAKIRNGIALERMDCSFQFAQGPEVLKLLETIEHDSETSVFIFSPNHLLAGKNTLVTSVT